MVKDQTRRIKQKELIKDITANDALKGVAGYAPLNPKCSLANLKALLDAMTAAQTTETQAQAAYRTARDKVAAAEWNFHNAILDAKDQVKAQFGKDSNELQALGLKKASEYRRQTGKRKA